MVSNIYEGNEVKIVKIHKHTKMERTFTLGCELVGCPGQFVMVSVAHAGEIPISISGFSSDTFEITVRNTGKVTSRLFEKKIGDKVSIRGPYGEGFPLADFQDQHLLVIAGGTAVAAVKPLIEYSLTSNDCAARKLDLLIGFRSPKHVLFKTELKGWEKNGGVIVTVDTTENDDEAWAGGIGFVVDFVKYVDDLGPETKVVVIGPPLMMTNTVKELSRHKVCCKNIWTSFERHMKCGVGKCGHCRIRDKYVCVDGPVFNYVEAASLID
ncbi:MAG: anaerobic sulfite reductase subunit AsrB [Planctomycetes bacterium]|nr:anaerobic sulfite reductase subunit AsrB [Planctomycetota bacterium]